MTPFSKVQALVPIILAHLGVQSWYTNGAPTESDADAFGKVYVSYKGKVKLLPWDSEKAQSYPWLPSNRPDFFGPGWITNRTPTAADGDVNGWVWGRTANGTVESFHIGKDEVRNGIPWQPIERPALDVVIDAEYLETELADILVSAGIQISGAPGVSDESDED